MVGRLFDAPSGAYWYQRLIDAVQAARSAGVPDFLLAAISLTMKKINFGLAFRILFYYNRMYRPKRRPLNGDMAQLVRAHGSHP